MTCPAHGLAASRNYLLKGDVDHIRWLIRVKVKRPFPVVVDLGAGSGTSALAVFAERPFAVVWTVDINQENLDWARLAVRNAYPGALWNGILGSSTSPEALALEPDIVLLDTSHVYLDTVYEIDAWQKQGRFLWAHDYRGPESKGVSRAIDEAVENQLLETLKVQGWSWSGVYK